MIQTVTTCYDESSIMGMWPSFPTRNTMQQARGSIFFYLSTFSTALEKQNKTQTITNEKNEARSLGCCSRVHCSAWSRIN